MAASAHRLLMQSICSRPAESGGLLLGPRVGPEITEFYFDSTALSTNVSYSPDHVTLNRLIDDVWTPAGLTMKGFAHSHPRGLDRLSGGDLVYIERLLNANPEMDRFAAPIVLPSEFRLCPFVVLREQPHQPIAAELILF